MFYFRPDGETFYAKRMKDYQPVQWYLGSDKPGSRSISSTRPLYDRPGRHTTTEKLVQEDFAVGPD